MDLEPQKNFYDKKRYFQGKDNPGDLHPAPQAGAISRGQLTFGVVFLVVIAALALLRVKQAESELSPTTAPVAAKKR
jgi:hypothetical protein